MELTDSNLQNLVGFLQQTLSPDVNVRRPAERFLESLEGNQNYPILLLNLVDKVEVDLTIRIAGAIIFKNFIKRNWRLGEDGPDKIHPNDRTTIKTLIVGLMLKSPEQIQRQLSDAVSIIGQEDFPDKWPNLLPEMILHFQSGDFHIINGVLRTAHSLFKRYRYEFKSQILWKEVKYVLDNFAKPLTDLFLATLELANTHANNPAALKIIFSSLVLIAKLFYSLNVQDLPEFFEDNMSTWMTNFLKLLTIENSILKSNDEEKPDLLDELKSQICSNITLYVQSYDEEFQPHLPNFVTAVWNLLTSTGSQPKYDMLVSNAIRFLSTVAGRIQNKKLFEDPTVLSSICEKVIIPNMEFRQADEELFEDNPEDYINKDIEGSDIDTRRRAACDLVKTLARFFEAEIMRVFSQYVRVLLENYTKDPSNQWKSKDAAIYLVTSMAAKGKTEKEGVTKTSELVNLTEFYRDFILPDLENPNINENPVLKADALKYLMIFRNMLPKQVVVASLPRVVQFMRASSQVVHTYAAYTIERVFTMKDGNSKPSITIPEVLPIAENLLNGLFGILEMPGSYENEYVMKAIMRTFSLLQESLLPYLPRLVSNLTAKLMVVAKNPNKPHFNHYLFECLSLSVRIVCKNNRQAISTFEEALFPVFQELLQQDVQEFIPYVFQILSLLLELHECPVPEPYMMLFPCLLVPILWERPGNISPLVRLLQAFIEKGAEQVIASDKLTAILGVFQKLIASKTNDHEGFYLLQSLIEYLSPSVLEPYLKQVFVILFTRLQSSKTTKYGKCLLVFFCLFAHKYGAETLIQIIDGIQDNMFGMVVERLIIADVQKVSGNIERKICAVGMTKLLTEAPSVIDGKYSSFWAKVLQALIALFELPEDDSIPDDEHFIEVEETPGYQISYVQLVFAGKRELDPFKGTIPDARINLALALHQLGVNNPGKLTPLVTNSLSPEVSSHLQKYLLAANVQLV